MADATVRTFVNVELDEPIGVRLTFSFVQEDDMWTGVCQELGTATYDADRVRVEDELEVLVLHALNAMESDGERERFFVRHGIETFALPVSEIAAHRELESPPLPLPIWMSEMSRGSLAAATA